MFELVKRSFFTTNTNHYVCDVDFHLTKLQIRFLIETRFSVRVLGIRTLYIFMFNHKFKRVLIRVSPLDHHLFYVFGYG